MGLLEQVLTPKVKNGWRGAHSFNGYLSNIFIVPVSSQDSTARAANIFKTLRGQGNTEQMKGLQL